MTSSSAIRIAICNCAELIDEKIVRLQTHQIKVLNEEAARKLKAQAKPEGGGGGPPSSAEGATTSVIQEEPGEEPTKPGEDPSV